MNPLLGAPARCLEGRLAKREGSLFIVWEVDEAAHTALLVELDRPQDGQHLRVPLGQAMDWLLGPLEVAEEVTAWH